MGHALNSAEPECAGHAYMPTSVRSIYFHLSRTIHMSIACSSCLWMNGEEKQKCAEQ